jgi:Fe2+ or Zn2+ uptake regulation protein
MEAYDLDDTLASVDFEQAPVRSLETVYRQAKVLYESGLIEPNPFPKGYQ